MKISNNKSIIFGPLPPPFGGVAVFMSALSASAAEFDVRIWSYKGRYLENSTAEIRYVNHKCFGHLFALIREGFKARITDSTHFHLEYPNPVLLPLWLIAKFFLRFKWIKILHDGSLPSRYEKFNRLQRWLFRSAICYIDEFIVCSRDLEIWLGEEVEFKKKNLFYSGSATAAAGLGKQFNR